MLLPWQRGFQSIIVVLMNALLSVYDRDLVLVSGKGCRLFDKDGRSCLDFAAGIGVNGYGDRALYWKHAEASGRGPDRAGFCRSRARR